MTLRQQLMLKRTLRNLRTWAPPISIGVILGVGIYFASEHLDRANAAPRMMGAIEQPAFRNCAAAQTAGAAPVHAGQPGYGVHLDRVGDGIGCEPLSSLAKS